MEVTVQKYITGNIERRYIKFSKETIDALEASGQLVIGDTIAPSCFVNGSVMPTNAVFISHTIASMFGKDALPFEYLLKTLKIKLKDLDAKFKELKDANLNLILIGYGGYSINTLEFLYQIANRLGISNLFKTLTIFENDKLTYTNCLRMYPNMSTIANVDNSMNKLHVLPQKYDGVLSDKIILYPEALSKDVYDARLKGKRVVFLGAPDFETRKFLEDAHFIFGGHYGDEVSLIANPHVNMEITTESYGTINPATLFMNLIYAATKLPEALLGKFEPNSTILDYNFRSQIESKSIKSEIDFLFNLPTIGVTA